MNKKRRIICIASTVLVFIILGSKLLTEAYRGEYTQVDSGRFDLAPDAADLMTPEGYNLDTGAGGSVIVSDSVPAIPFVGFGFVTDCHRQRRLITYSYLPNLPLTDSLTLTHIVADNLRDNEFFRQKGISLVLGFPVIRKANWLFSFRENRAEAMPLSHVPTIPSHALCIPFDTSSGLPVAQLKVSDTTLNFLIDTGCTGCDLKIKDQEALQEICNGLTFSTDTNYSQGYFGEISEPRHTFDSLNIEGTSYHNVIVPNSANSSHNLLGLDFLRRHDTMFWDSANRRMYLWNESPSPHDKETSPSGEGIGKSPPFPQGDQREPHHRQK